jgi:hypothetical protein
LKTLEIQKNNYGEDHVNYAKSLNKFCISLEKLGELEKAKEGF